MKVSILVPAYNEINTIAKMLERLRQVPLDKEIVVVDDGSTDGTRAYLAGLHEEGLRVILHPQNRGKGAALRSALARATGEVVIVQDADLEYMPEEIPKVVAPILEGRAEVAYGSRFRGDWSNMKPLYRLANSFFALFANLLFGLHITDEATCYKAFRTDLLRSLDLQCNRFEFCPEVTAKIGRLHKGIEEVPITYRARTFAEGKKIGWREGFQVLATLLRWRFAKWQPTSEQTKETNAGG